jgi:hypothetical protein
MSRFRYPGIISLSGFCTKEPQQPSMVIACQQQPRIAYNPCNTLIMDRAVVRINTCDGIDGIDSVYFETFGNLILIPTNFNSFCGYNFKGGEIIAIEAENVSENVSNTTCLLPETNNLHVKILYIAKTWHKLIRNFNGIVTKNIDRNGQSYYMLTEITDLTLSDSNYKELNNSLLFRKIIIQYDIVNIMGISDVSGTLESFVGHNVSGVYVDYGTEARYRDGIPIVITEYTIN